MDAFEQRVRERAYEIWQTSGMDHGSADLHWLSAEQSVISEAEQACTKVVKPAKTAKAVQPSKTAKDAKSAKPSVKSVASRKSAKAAMSASA